MLRPVVLGLLLACAVSLSSSTVILEDGKPLLWAQTTGNLTDLPTKNGVITPDPWHYLQRMTLLRLLIGATNPFMSSMGTNTTANPLWGLPLQLGWLMASGRLVDPTNTTTCGLETGDTMCISTESWWSCVNYFVSALPFLSAAKQGIFGAGIQVKMQVPEGVTDYCTTYDNCAAAHPNIMKKWDAFFQGLKSEGKSTLPVNEKKDYLLGLYWAAKEATYVPATCKPRKNNYSSVEIRFADSWLDSIEYTSATHFQTSLDETPMFITPLPSRVLKEGDVPPNIADLSTEENQTLRTFSWMSSINTGLGGSLVSVWKKAMCSVETREKGRAMLTQLFKEPGSATTAATFMTIITGWGGC